MPTRLDPAQLARCLQPGTEVFAPGGGGHSAVFEDWLKRLAARTDRVRFTGVHLPGVNRFDFASLHPRARERTPFLSEDLRRSWLNDQVDYLPVTYSGMWRWLSHTARFDLALLQVAAPDADGNCSFGIACDFSPAAWPRSARIFAHVNPLMPRTQGPGIPWDRIDGFVESAAEPLEIPDPPLDPVMDTVASNVATLVPDGATLQLGLGKLQAAVLRALRGHRDLRIHSGMVSDGLLDLLSSGALMTAPEAATAGVAIGTRRLYDAVAAVVRFRDVGYTHDHRVLSAIPHLIAVNSALSVDLLGQVNGDVLGGRQISGVGGLPDFLRGARDSAGGRGIIALPARTRSGQSRIVALLRSGPVSVARADADCVVTEFGIADLRVLDVHARALAMIGIAHPADRDTLERAWHELSRQL